MQIDKAVLLPVGTENRAKAQEMIQRYPNRFIAFHWIDFDNDIDEELCLLRVQGEASRVKGVKFQPMDQHMVPNDKRIYPVYELCQELGLMVTWHSGMVALPFKYELGGPMLSKYCDPTNFDEVAYEFPKLRICIAHLGGNFMYNALILAEKHENIYLDTAFLGFFAPHFFPPTDPSALITHAVTVAGAEKILFGCEGVTPEDVRKADISEEAKEKVLGLNAAKLLSLAD